MLRSQDEPGDDYSVLPIVTVANKSDRPVKGFTLVFRNRIERRGYYERVASSIDPNAVYTSGQHIELKRYIRRSFDRRRSPALWWWKSQSMNQGWWLRRKRSPDIPC